MTKFSSRTASLLVAALLASAASAQTDTRGVRILLPTEAPPPAPAPEVVPSPAPTPAPSPKAPELTKRPTNASQPLAPAQREPNPARTEVPRVAPTPTPAPLPCIRAFARADMAFSEGSGPRKKLRDLLQSKPQRLVLDIAPFAPATVPEALSPWFAEVRASGGTVSETEIKCTRGFSLAKLFSGLFGRRDPSQDYWAIRGYDAFLWVDDLQKLVRQVELRRRDPQN